MIVTTLRPHCNERFDHPSGHSHTLARQTATTRACMYTYSHIRQPVVCMCTRVHMRVQDVLGFCAQSDQSFLHRVGGSPSGGMISRCIISSSIPSSVLSLPSSKLPEMVLEHLELFDSANLSVSYLCKSFACNHKRRVLWLWLHANDLHELRNA